MLQIPRSLLSVVATALLAVVAAGATAGVSLAQTQQPPTPTQNSQVSGDTGTADVNNVQDVQSGDQTTLDTSISADASVETSKEASAETSAETAIEGQDAAPESKAVIAAQDAQKTAEAYAKAGTATSITLDDENGRLVYSIQIGETDVKVDAMTGIVIGTDDAGN